MVMLETVNTEIDSGTHTMTNKTLTNPTINFTDKAVAQNVLCRAYLASDQSNITDATATKVLLANENFDIGSDFDTTNKRFVAPVTGYYQVNACVGLTGLTADKRGSAEIWYDGEVWAWAWQSWGGITTTRIAVADIVYAVAGKYIELYTTVIVGNNNADILGTTTSTFMSVHLISI